MYGQTSEKLYAIVELDGKYGLISNPDSLIIPVKYQLLNRLSSGYFAGQLNDKWGLLSPQGKILTNFKYDFIREVDGFFEGKMFKVGFYNDIQDLIGLIDTTGKVVVPLEFKYIETTNFKNILMLEKSKSITKFYEFYSGKIFSDSYEYDLNKGSNYIFCSKKGRYRITKYGIKDSLFNEVLPVKYYKIQYYNTQKEIFIVQTKTKKYLIKNKKILLDVTDYYDIKELSKTTFSALKDYKWRIVDIKTGQPLSENTYYSRPVEINDNFYLVSYMSGAAYYIDSNQNFIMTHKSLNDSLLKKRIEQDNEFKNLENILICINHKFGLKNKFGKEIAHTKYDYILQSKFEKYIVMINGKWGLMNKFGEEITPIKYDMITPLKFEKFSVEINNKLGIINTKGKEITPVFYNKIYDNYFDHNYLVYRDGIANIVDSLGKELISDMSITNIHYCGKGKYIAEYEMNNIRKFGVVNSVGRIIVPFEYDIIFRDDNNHFKLKKNNKWGIANFEGRIIVPIEFDDIKSPDNLTYQVTKNNIRDSNEFNVWENDEKTGIIDSTGRIILECKYSSINLFNGYYYVSIGEKIVNLYGYHTLYRSDAKKGILNKNGVEILPTIYDDISIEYYGGDYFKVDLNRNEDKPRYIYKNGKSIFSERYNIIVFEGPMSWICNPTPNN